MRRRRPRREPERLSWPVHLSGVCNEELRRAPELHDRRRLGGHPVRAGAQQHVTVRPTRRTHGAPPPPRAVVTAGGTSTPDSVPPPPDRTATRRRRTTG